MNATLEVYLQILSRVLAKPTPGPGGPGGPEGQGVMEARPALRKLQEELKRVKRHYYHNNHNNPLQTALDRLHNIKVCLSVRLSVCMSIYLSICLPFSIARSLYLKLSVKGCISNVG